MTRRGARCCRYARRNIDAECSWRFTEYARNVLGALVGSVARARELYMYVWGGLARGRCTELQRCAAGVNEDVRIVDDVSFLPKATKCTAVSLTSLTPRRFGMRYESHCNCDLRLPWCGKSDIAYARPQEDRWEDLSKMFSKTTPVYNVSTNIILHLRNKIEWNGAALELFQCSKNYFTLWKIETDRIELLALCTVTAAITC